MEWLESRDLLSSLSWSAGEGGDYAGGSTSEPALTAYFVPKPLANKSYVWHNSTLAFDVTGPTGEPDGVVAADDALEVINYINAHGAGHIPTGATANPPFLDTVNAKLEPIGDDYVVAGDALGIINYINGFDPSALQPFYLLGPSGVTNQTTLTVSWEPSTKATKYDLTIAQQPDCTGVVQTFSNLTTTSQQVTFGADGSYFSCVTAKDNLNRKLNATNNGLVLTIDTIPPGDFSFTEPNGIQTSVNVNSKWGASPNASKYVVSLHSANNCTSGSSLGDVTVTTTSTMFTVPGDGTYFLCATAQTAAGTTKVASNQPYSFQVTQPVVVQETVVKDWLSDASCWTSSPTPYLENQYNPANPPLYGHIGVSFLGNGQKLKQISVLVMDQDSSGNPNLGLLSGVLWDVFFFSDSNAFKSDPDLSSQPSGSSNVLIQNLAPTNADPNSPNYYLKPVGHFGGAKDFNIFRIDLDVSQFNIQTTAGATQLVTLAPQASVSDGLFETLFANDCASGVGTSSDWYKFPPQVNPTPDSLSNLGAPYARTTSRVTTVP